MDDSLKRRGQPYPKTSLTKTAFLIWVCAIHTKPKPSAISRACERRAPPFITQQWKHQSKTTKSRTRPSTPSTRGWRLPQKSDAERGGGRRARGAEACRGQDKLEATKTELKDVQKEFKELEPRLSFAPKLPTSVLLSITVSSERELASALLA